MPVKTKLKTKSVVKPKLKTSVNTKLNIGKKHKKGKNEWQLQEAKAMLSEVVKASQKEHQFITIHGHKTAVIISYDEYEEMTTPEQSIVDFFQNSPFFGVELELPKRGELSKREVNL